LVRVLRGLSRTFVDEDEWKEEVEEEDTEDDPNRDGRRAEVRAKVDGPAIACSSVRGEQRRMAMM
jgi:hypothetical protein